MFGGCRRSKMTVLYVRLVLRQIRQDEHSPVPPKKVKTYCTSPTPHLTYLPSPAPSMGLSSEPTAIVPGIPLEGVPPLYNGRCTPLGLNLIIVGAGIGGLAVAHTLAHAGHHVSCSSLCMC